MDKTKFVLVANVDYTKPVRERATCKGQKHAAFTFDEGTEYKDVTCRIWKLAFKTHQPRICVAPQTHTSRLHHGGGETWISIGSAAWALSCPPTSGLDNMLLPQRVDMITHLCTQPEHDCWPQTLAYLMLMEDFVRYTLHHGIHVVCRHSSEVLSTGDGRSSTFTMLG
ncbi:hypothetical protein KCU77_g77, partial [Aureobasidium melanogenum]